MMMVSSLFNLNVKGFHAGKGFQYMSEDNVEKNRTEFSERAMPIMVPLNPEATSNNSKQLGKKIDQDEWQNNQAHKPKCNQCNAVNPNLTNNVIIQMSCPIGATQLMQTHLVGNC